MIVLVAEFGGSSKLMPYLRKNKWGRMWASYGPQWNYDGEPWGFDNGAWSAFVQRTEFPAEKFKRRIAKAVSIQPYSPCVAVLPDVVGDARRTLESSSRWASEGLPRWPWFFALQDGVTQADADAMLPFAAGYFLGGSDRFKCESAKWCDYAHSHGKLFHFGRCNREAWVYDAIRIGADSIDSATPILAATINGQAGVGRFKRWETIVNGRCRQQELPLGL